MCMEIPQHSHESIHGLCLVQEFRNFHSPVSTGNQEWRKGDSTALFSLKAEAVNLAVLHNIWVMLLADKTKGFLQGGQYSSKQPILHQTTLLNAVQLISQRNCTSQSIQFKSGLSVHHLTCTSSIQKSGLSLHHLSCISSTNVQAAPPVHLAFPIYKQNLKQAYIRHKQAQKYVAALLWDYLTAPIDAVELVLARFSAYSGPHGDSPAAGQILNNVKWNLKACQDAFAIYKQRART